MVNIFTSENKLTDEAMNICKLLNIDHRDLLPRYEYIKFQKVILLDQLRVYKRKMTHKIY